MFDTEYIVEQIEFSDASSICVLGRKTAGQCVLSELALPSKIVDKNRRTVAMSSDLRIKSGIFPAAPIAQILCIYGEGKVVAAEESLPGVAVYELNVADSDQILRSGTLKAPLTQPVLSLVDATTLLLTANRDEKPLLLDLTSGQTCAPLHRCSCTPTEDVLPAVVSPTVALLCRRKDSESILYDVRSGTKVGCIIGNNKCDVWTVTTNYHALRHPTPSLTTFAFLSASGLLRVYDLRKLDQEISNCQLELPDTNKEKVAIPRIHLSPSGDYLSVSGYDSAVSVYHLGPSNLATEVFRHDGHNHMEQCHGTELTTITDHVWEGCIYLASGLLHDFYLPKLLKVISNKKLSKSSPTAAGSTYDEEDEYYDEAYDYDYEDMKATNANSTSREKRSVDEHGGRIHNVLHMRTLPVNKHAQENPPVLAKIFIVGDEQGEQNRRPNFVRLQTKEEEVHHGNGHGHHRSKSLEDGCDQHIPVLAHFGADSGGSASIGLPHYEANHRMYHPEGVFRNWTPAAWVPHQDSQIVLDEENIIVKEPGIYFFYAQIFYANSHDRSGFRVFVNHRPVFQCTTTTRNCHGSNHMKWNSCFTGGLIKLSKYDNLTLREIEGDRYTVFEKTKSFFGLFRVAVKP